MPYIIPVFLNHLFFFQIDCVRWDDECGGRGGPVVGAQGRAAWRSGDGAVGPVSSLIGSPNHSKKLPVSILFLSVGCFMNSISI